LRNARERKALQVCSVPAHDVLCSSTFPHLFKQLRELENILMKGNKKDHRYKMTSMHETPKPKKRDDLEKL